MSVGLKLFQSHLISGQDMRGEGFVFPLAQTGVDSMCKCPEYVAETLRAIAPTQRGKVSTLSISVCGGHSFQLLFVNTRHTQERGHRKTKPRVKQYQTFFFFFYFHRRHLIITRVELLLQTNRTDERANCRHCRRPKSRHFGASRGADQQNYLSPITINFAEDQYEVLTVYVFAMAPRQRPR